MSQDLSRSSFNGSEPDGAPLVAGAPSATAAVATVAGATRAVGTSTTQTRKVPPRSTGTPKRYTPPKTLEQRKAEEALAKSGASRAEIAAASRAAARTGGTGAYHIPEQGRWVPYVMGACLVIGTLLIVVNYIAEISALGMPSPWYLAGGLFMLVLGFLSATKLR